MKEGVLMGSQIKQLLGDHKFEKFFGSKEKQVWEPFCQSIDKLPKECQRRKIQGKDLIRVVEDLDGTVESTDTIAKLKTKIEKSSTFESDADFVKTLIKNCIDEEEELNDYEKLQSIVLREFQVTPRECLNSFKNAVKSSGETYIQFAARLTANFQYYCSLRKVNSFESLCDLLISDKLFETLNKEIATHIGIREAEDWFRPIDLAKECDIYISSRSGSRKETPIACGYTEDPFKNRPRNYKP
ncbi:uncharacterized protein TNCV_4601641 [Trichonephila clavipes]|nr:uncharacterized protein TNCV_4601641 [Trichonephila clavipes]